MAQQETARITYELDLPAGKVSLQCALLLSGCYPVPADIRYEHPHPPFNRLFYFMKGGCTVRAACGEFQLASGQFYLLPADQSFSVAYRGGSRFIYVHFHCTAPGGGDAFRDTTGVLPLPLPASRALGRELARLYFQPGYAPAMQWHSIVWNAVAKWAGYLFASHSDTYMIPARYREVTEYIRENLAPDLRLTELADRQHCTVSALAKGFRRTYGIGLKAFILRELMQRARELLTGTDLPVFQVARELGYVDPFYFQRVFRQQMDLTPLQYRQTYRKSEACLPDMHKNEGLRK